jgi:hypothetical protein
MDVEMSEMGNVRVNVGIHPSGFGWKLEEGIEVLLNTVTLTTLSDVLNRRSISHS